MEANSRYAEVSYWEERYATEDHYEWLGQGYQQALDLLAATLGDRDARILILGCGNSHLSRDLRLLGFRDVLSTDISRTCVERMRAATAGDPSLSGLRWAVLDMTDMSSLPDGSFDAVVEKATLDALLVNERSPWEVSDATEKVITAALGEISRVLRPDGGRFVSISFAQPHFRTRLLARPEYGWGVSHGVLNPDSAFHFYHYVMTRGEELGAVPNACPGPEIEEESDYSLSDEADDSFLSRMSEITDD